MSSEIFEFFDSTPGVLVQDSEYCRLLGYPSSHTLEGRSKEIAGWVRRWYESHGHPWIYAREVDTFGMDSGSITLDGASFLAPRLRKLLERSEARSAVIVAVSAGKECEEKARMLWEEEKPDEYFFLEVYGSAVVESLLAAASFRLCEWGDKTGVSVLPHYSPGYPGWDISEQKALLDIIHPRSPAIPLAVKVLESGMLKPKKSLLAVFGITSRNDLVARITNMIPCESCSLPSCRYRRSPYRTFLPQIERSSQTRIPKNISKTDSR